jgi:hypothetical protein
MNNKIKQITAEELEALAVGSAILGSGGGGDPAVDKRVAQRQIEQHGPVRLMQVDELTKKDLVVPLAIMGAPLVGIEKIGSGKEFSAILKKIEKYYGKKPTVLMTPEIGGGNAFAPLQVAGACGLPLLDADSLGRAFPKLQMSSFNLHGITASPAFLSDSDGNVVILQENDSDGIEAVARNVTVSFGSVAHIGIYIMPGDIAQTAVISGTVSRAIQVGNAVLQAQKNNTDPIAAITKITNGVCIGTGSIADVNQVVSEGFLNGTVDIVSAETNNTIQLSYQNEHFIASVNSKRVASTPDIIIPIDIQTGRAITTESMTYGSRVAVLIIPSDELWRTKEGLALVGPQAFGCDFEYKDCKKLLEQI